MFCRTDDKYSSIHVPSIKC